MRGKTKRKITSGMRKKIASTSSDIKSSSYVDIYVEIEGGGRCAHRNRKGTSAIASKEGLMNDNIQSSTMKKKDVSNVFQLNSINFAPFPSLLIQSFLN